MRVYPYLSFDGQCEAALRLYEECLGGKVIYRLTYAESPAAAQLPAEWSNRIYHATFALGEQRFGAADAPPDAYKRPQGLVLTIEVEDPAEADRIYEGLSKNDIVQMPLQETHWALRFGVVTDQFGTPWMISCNAPA